MDVNDILKKIDKKIAELEKAEEALELLRKALTKRGLIKKKEEISKEKLEELFKLLKDNIK